MQYAAHLGWLHASLDVGKNSVARITTLHERSLYKKLPDAHLGYILDLFHESGKFSSGSMSIQSLTWAELKSFGDIFGLTGWEMQTIKAMSKVYVDNTRTEKLDPCPTRYDYEEVLRENGYQNEFSMTGRIKYD